MYHTTAAYTPLLALACLSLLGLPLHVMGLPVLSLTRFSPTSWTTCNSRTTLSFHRLFASSPRPSLDDVERISRGQAAKKRGTGSRNVPHRLNEMERREWDLAKKRRYLLVRGSGWRKERGDSPLLNIYRQLCDALDIPSISVQRGVREAGENGLIDAVHIDFSPLRRLDIASSLAKEIISEATTADTYPSFHSITDNSNTNGLVSSGDDGKDLLDLTSPPSKGGLDESAGSVEVEDTVDGQSDSLGLALREDVIWRVPVFGVIARFGERKDARAFAESLAVRLAGGKVAAAAVGSVGDDADDDDE